MEGGWTCTHDHISSATYPRNKLECEAQLLKIAANRLPFDLRKQLHDIADEKLLTVRALDEQHEAESGEGHYKPRE